MAQRFRILTVDDNEAIHEDFRKLLLDNVQERELADISAELFGDERESDDVAPNVPVYELTTALQGQAGFELVRDALQAGDPFALAFVDLRMPPGWDGIVTIQKMWEVDRDLQVVVCSAYSDYSWREMVTALGTTDRMLFLRKPFDGVAVKQIAMALTEKWRLARTQREALENLEFSVAERTYELRTALDDLEQKNFELICSNNNRAEFLARMSGEIRTPLNGILGMAQLLADTPLTAPQQRHLTVVQRCGDALLHILDDILHYAKIEAGFVDLEQSEFDLRDLIDDVVSMFPGTLQSADVELAAVIEPNVPDRLHGDMARLRQILTALVASAARETVSGTVVVRADVIDSEGESESESASEPQLELAVEDSGRTLSDEEEQALFLPFGLTSRGPRRPGDSGLDLAITQKTVQMMRGTIAVRRRPHAGKAIVMRFPLPDGRRAALAVPSRRAVLIGGSPLLYESLRSHAYLQGIAVEHCMQIDDVIAKLRRDRDGLGDIFCVQSHFDRLFSMLWPNGVRVGKSPRVFPIIEPASGYSDADFAVEAVDGVLRAPLRYGEIALVVGPTFRQRADDSSDLGEMAVRGAVLLVEDDEINRVVAQRMLESLGCTVYLASDGADALHKLMGEEIDLVLMDLTMPEIDGLAATRNLRLREVSGGRRVPVVAMTASVLADARQRCEQAGMDGFIAKPVTRQELANVISHWLPRREVREVS